MAKHLTPIKAIRQKCLECSGYQPSEVRLCTAENCPLFPYRMGKRAYLPIQNPKHIKKQALSPLNFTKNIASTTDIEINLKNLKGGNKRAQNPS